MKPNTSNLAARVEALAARAKEATRLFNHLARAKRQAEGYEAQIAAIKADGLPDNSPLLKLRQRTAEKLVEARAEVHKLEKALAVEIDGPIGLAARRALLEFEGESGAGAANYEDAPFLLALHDVVCDPARLPNVSRNAFAAGSSEVPLAT